MIEKLLELVFKEQNIKLYSYQTAKECLYHTEQLQPDLLLVGYPEWVNDLSANLDHGKKDTEIPVVVIHSALIKPQNKMIGTLLTPLKPLEVVEQLETILAENR